MPKSDWLKNLRLCQPTHGEDPRYVHYVSAEWLRGLADYVEGLEQQREALFEAAERVQRVAGRQLAYAGELEDAKHGLLNAAMRWKRETKP